jgi:hypothetical protein
VEGWSRIATIQCGRISPRIGLEVAVNSDQLDFDQLEVAFDPVGQDLNSIQIYFL